MNCPNCGAPMSLAAPGAPWSCTHCGTTLRPQPGDTVDVRVVGQGTQPCPVCHVDLRRALMNERVTVQSCDRCEGLLMKLPDFARTLIAQRAAARTPAVTPPPPDPAQLDRPLDCPRCGGRMLTDWYYGPGGMVVDTCPTCDLIWLDAGELQRAVDAPGPGRKP